MSRYIEETGNKYGNLVVLIGAIFNKQKQAVWLCGCSCGKVKFVSGVDLRSGRVQSCGCLKRKKFIERVTTHGMSGTSTYRSWQCMIQRCTNPNNQGYFDYGERGIKVCEKWRVFENFFSDMGERPDGSTIDRIDNEKGYHLENCRWATPVEQSRNQRISKNNKTGINGIYWDKRRNKYGAAFTLNGKTHHLGRFNTLEQAIKIRKKAEQRYWGWGG